jgi:RNA 2',3'-cyclic 3'-phosphodiesterase
MRLFAGVELGRELQAASAHVAAELRADLARWSPGTRARWTPAENLHVTLFFLGETGDDRVPSIVGALQPSFETPSFVLGLGGAGVFPPSGPPRIIWLGVATGAAPLGRLQGEVTARLGPLGFEAERRPYHGHVTIARVADCPRSEQSAFRHTVRGCQAAAGSCPVGHVTLFRSRLSPKGAAYEPLLRVPLKP